MNWFCFLIVGSNSLQNLRVVAEQVSSPSHPFGLEAGKKKKNCSVLFSVISRSFLVRLKTCWFLLIQSSGETCLKFRFTMWFFQRLKFPFKYKILYLQICIYKYKSCHLSSDIFFRGLQRLIQLVHGIKNVCLECWFL